MKHREMALVLLKKAKEDEVLLDEIIDRSHISDGIFGFHCQQAVEKLLKAALSINEVEYRKTHDLRELLDKLTDNKIEYPKDIEEVDFLYPYAVEFRYDMVPFDEEEPLDRGLALLYVKKVRAWVESVIGNG